MINVLKEKNKVIFFTREKIKIFILFIKDFINHFLFIFWKKLFRLNSSQFNKSILLINTEQFGDILLSIDFLYSIQESNKFSERYLLIQDQYIDIITKLGLKFIVIGYNKFKYRYNILYRFRLLNYITKLKLGLILNITPERGSLNDELSLIPFAEKHIAIKSQSPFLSSYALKKNNMFYSDFVNSEEKNVYENYKNTLAYLKISLKEWIKDNLLINKNMENEYVLIAPSASDNFRNWSKENFKILTLSLIKNYKVILIGTRKQKKLLSFIANENKNVEIKIELKFEEIFELMLNAKIFIGLDSGLSHLAVLLNKNMVAIIGGGKFGLFFPYKLSSNFKYIYHKMDCFGCQWNCKYVIPYCIKKINIEEIHNSIKELITEQK